jgi:hypothetical protein
MRPVIKSKRYFFEILVLITGIVIISYFFTIDPNPKEQDSHSDLIQFITALRQVPAAEGIREQNIEKVKLMSTSELFNNQLMLGMKDRYSKAGNSEKPILLKSVLTLGSHASEVVWQEESNVYKAIVVYNLNPAIRESDTLGITVKDISVSQIIRSQP